jgi:hypothetical protein
LRPRSFRLVHARLTSASSYQISGCVIRHNVVYATYSVNICTDLSHIFTTHMSI